MSESRLDPDPLGDSAVSVQRLPDHSGYEVKGFGVLAPVTTVLNRTSKGKERLEKWLKRPGAEAASKAARTRGTWTHQQIENWICGLPTEKHFAFSSYFRNVRPWLEENFIRAVGIEKPIWHPMPAGFAGTFDCLGYAKGEKDPEGELLTLMDWKTSQNDRRKTPDLVIEYCHQLGAYAAGIRNTFGIEVERALLVIARPHGDGPDVWDFTAAELAEFEAAFLSRVSSYYELLKD